MTWVASLSRRHDAAGRLVIFGQRGVAWRGVAWRGVAWRGGQRSAAQRGKGESEPGLLLLCTVGRVGTMAHGHRSNRSVGRLGSPVPSLDDRCPPCPASRRTLLERDQA
jgi:hypothetical protein